MEHSSKAAIEVNTCLRKHMSPILLESLLFLKLDRRSWNLKLVSETMNAQPSEQFSPSVVMTFMILAIFLFFHKLVTK